MTGDELKAAGIKLFGEKGWQSSLAEWLDVDRTQIWRYVKNNSVPGPVRAAVECAIAAKSASDDAANGGV